jgi:hypothetical protein
MISVSVLIDSYVLAWIHNTLTDYDQFGQHARINLSYGFFHLFKLALREPAEHRRELNPMTNCPDRALTYRSRLIGLLTRLFGIWERVRDLVWGIHAWLISEHKCTLNAWPF